MILSEYLDHNRTLLANHIQTSLHAYGKKHAHAPYLPSVIEKVIDFATSGKLIRGSLVLLSAEMFGAEVNTNVLNAATGMELTHASFLVHDDIMDRDDLRRGKKTIHAQYSDIARENNWPEADFYGTSMGICAGDIVINLASDFVIRSSTNPEKLHQLTALYFPEVNKVYGSQMLDQHLGFVSKEPTRDVVLEMYRNKSARYTFSLPFMMGAVLAGCNNQTIASLEKLGENLGLVFQMKDDAIEVFGTAEEIGKPVGSDFREHKKTYLRAMLYEKLSNEEKKWFGSLRNDTEVGEENIQRIIQLLRKYNVEDELNVIMSRYTSEAKQHIEDLEANEKFTNILHELADYNLNRKS